LGDSNGVSALAPTPSKEIGTSRYFASGKIALMPTKSNTHASAI
jgi:hypothetical protein